jgi:transcriptional regulator with XRE-family HTH domain
MLLVFLIMDELADSTAPTERKTGRHSTLTPEIHEKILGFVRKGLTYEKAGEALGISPATIQNWQHRNKAFNESLQKARRGLEANLLDSINQAGEKSWQARAWILERSFSYSQPSARLQVSQDVTHGISGNLAQLLAGIAGRKKNTASAETARLENSSKYIDVQPIAQDDKIDKSHTKVLYQIPQVFDAQHIQNKTLLKVKHKPMRRRKPRAESLAKYPPTTTPPATPPAPI